MGEITAMNTEMIDRITEQKHHQQHQHFFRCIKGIVFSSGFKRFLNHPSTDITLNINPARTHKQNKILSLRSHKVLLMKTMSYFERMLGFIETISQIYTTTSTTTTTT